MLLRRSLFNVSMFDLQEPTDSLEEMLLLSQPDFSLGTENGGEEAGNPSAPHTDNPINHSPDNARAYPFCTRVFSNRCCVSVTTEQMLMLLTISIWRFPIGK